MIELVLVVKDKSGASTNKRKYYWTDSAEEASNIWDRENPHNKINKEERTQSSEPKKIVTKKAKIKSLLFKHLDKLKDLQPNWDSYNGLPINILNIEAAKEIISAIFDVVDDRINIVPKNDGSVCLEIKRFGMEREIDITVMDAGKFVHIYKFSPSENVNETSDYGLNTTKIREEIDWFNKV